MAKAKAPVWLREAFRDGVDERDAGLQPGRRNSSADGFSRYHGACWLAQFDPLQRPCAGPLERMHCVPRQRVENAMGALLLGAEVEEYWNDWNGEEGGAGTDRFIMPQDWREELVLLAAWDPRIARIGCGHEHHPRFDSKQEPTLIVPRSGVPDHIEEWGADYGLDFLLDERFPDTVPPSQR